MLARPEMKVERTSYPVMNPSAARGLLESIYCKPIEFRWCIERIEVLRPIRYIALRRNEMKNRISMASVNRMMIAWRNPSSLSTLMILRKVPGAIRLGRTQRQTIALKDVRYRIHAESDALRVWRVVWCPLLAKPRDASPAASASSSPFRGAGVRCLL